MTTLIIKDYTKRTQSTLRRIVLGSIALLLAAPLYAARPQTHRQECKDDARAKGTAFYKGADISWVTEMEAKGYSFANARGEARECTALMKELDLQAIRLRVWVNPQDGFCGTEDVVNKALRAQKLGMDVLIDFHYSDSWAGPSKQYIPAAWKNHTYAQILDDVKQHTTGVLQALKAAGVSPKWVQVGNETSDGLLWEVVRASKQAAQYAGIIDAGYAAVKSVFADALVLVHLDNGFNQDLYKWNLNLLKQYGARFDMVGMSLYPDAAVKYNNEQNVSAAIDHCMQNIAFVRRTFGVPTMIVETGFNVTRAAEGKAGLSLLLRRAAENADCRGVFYWEPEAPNGYNGGYDMGAFTERNKVCSPTIIMEAFSEASTGLEKPTIAPTKANEDVAYDLAGRRISMPYKGFYITQGQKYIRR